MIKVLHCVENYLPERSGMQEVVTQLSERLQKKGFHVTIATTKHPERTDKFINGIQIEEFDIKGNYVTGYKGDTDSYQRFILEGDYDIIVNFAAQQWSTDLLLPILQHIKAKKIFVPTGFSALNNPAYKKYYENMRVWMKNYDENVFLSGDYRDINFARSIGLNAIRIIPNGASHEEFNSITTPDARKWLNCKEDDFVILLVGSFTGLKGHFEAMRIFNRAKIRNATLVLIGNSPRINGVVEKVKNLIRFLLAWSSNKRPIGRFYYDLMASVYNATISNRRYGKRILIKTLPRNKIIEWYKAADLFVFPSMIECSPIVLFESMAARLPFLTNDVGNAKEIITWTGGGEVMATNFDSDGYSRSRIDAAANHLTELYQDQTRRSQLTSSGYVNFIKRFSWDRIADQYAELYISLTGKFL